MPDREKVIDRLQKVSSYFKSMLKVGYDGDSDIYREHRESVKMAIALLKEQEAVKPRTDDAWPSRIKTCGACGTCLFTVGDYKPKYCSECGRRVKWNE